MPLNESCYNLRLYGTYYQEEGQAKLPLETIGLIAHFLESIYEEISDLLPKNTASSWVDLKDTLQLNSPLFSLILSKYSLSIDN